MCVYVCVCVCVCGGGREGESKVYFIKFRFFSFLRIPCKILIEDFIVLKHSIICIFLIHSDSVQKMLTALFRLVWNTQKIHGQVPSDGLWPLVT